jgi:hypothetical protein
MHHCVMCRRVLNSDDTSKNPMIVRLQIPDVMEKTKWSPSEYYCNTRCLAEYFCARPHKDISPND